MARDNLESEVKIPVTDLEATRAALHRVGATCVQEAERETNLVFDSNDGQLRRAGSVLRLRRHGERHSLTFKGPARFRGAVKERPEYEAVVSNFDTVETILERLGYRVYMRYEKDREEWCVADVSVVLDRTPMGDFVELEGPRERLEETAHTLGLDPCEAVRGSYVSLWQEYRSHHPELDLPFDMVFPE